MDSKIGGGHRPRHRPLIVRDDEKPVPNPVRTWQEIRDAVIYVLKYIDTIQIAPQKQATNIARRGGWFAAKLLAETGATDRSSAATKDRLTELLKAHPAEGQAFAILLRKASEDMLEKCSPESKPCETEDTWTLAGQVGCGESNVYPDKSFFEDLQQHLFWQIA
jgi:hypothetical protein